MYVMHVMYVMYVVYVMYVMYAMYVVYVMYAMYVMHVMYVMYVMYVVYVMYVMYVVYVMYVTLMRVRFTVLLEFPFCNPLPRTWNTYDLAWLGTPWTSIPKQGCESFSTWLFTYPKTKHHEIPLKPPKLTMHPPPLRTRRCHRRGPSWRVAPSPRGGETVEMGMDQKLKLEITWDHHQTARFNR